MNNNVKDGLRALGIIVIVLGLIGSFLILISFDYETYNHIKDLPLTYSEEIAIMKAERIDTWVTGIGLAIGSLTMGLVLLALERLITLLEEIESKIAKESQDI